MCASDRYGVVVFANDQELHVPCVLAAVIRAVIMFSVDDSFEVEEEAFLGVFRKVHDRESHRIPDSVEPIFQRKSFEIEQDYVNTEKFTTQPISVQACDVITTSTRNSVTAGDPLGLNGSSRACSDSGNELVVRSLEQGRVVSAAVSRLDTSVGDIHSNPNQTTISSVSNVGMSLASSVDCGPTIPKHGSLSQNICTPGFKTRKFHFRPSPKISPAVSKSDPLSVARKGFSQQLYEAGVPNTPTSPEETATTRFDIGKCAVMDDKVLFEISQDSWESELDLSLEQTPKWKPQPDISKQGKIYSVLKPTDILNSVSVFGSDYPQSMPLLNKVNMPYSSCSAISNPPDGQYSTTDRDMDDFPNTLSKKRNFLKAQLSSLQHSLAKSPNKAQDHIHNISKSISTTPISTRPGTKSLRLPTESETGPVTVSRSSGDIYLEPESPLATTSDMPLTVRPLLTPNLMKDHSAQNRFLVEDSSMTDTPITKTNCAQKRKRKFPGPAGALPKLKSNVNFTVLEKYEDSSPKTLHVKQKIPVFPHSQISCSQNSEEKFLEGPWQTMKQDLEPQAQEILQEFSIQNIIRKASKKMLPRGKVPILCALIDQISIENAEASAILKDPSGEMKGTVHRMVVKEHVMEMQPGTVLVLRQVGVFSPSSARNHYLNITPNNLVRLYARGDNTSILAKKVAGFEQDDFKIPILPTTVVALNNSRFDVCTPGRKNSGYRSPAPVMPQWTPSKMAITPSSPKMCLHGPRASIPRFHGLTPRTPDHNSSSMNFIPKTPTGVSSMRTSLAYHPTSGAQITPRTAFTPGKPPQDGVQTARHTVMMKKNTVTSPQSLGHCNVLFNTGTFQNLSTSNGLSNTSSSHRKPSVSRLNCGATKKLESFNDLWQDDPFDELLDGLGDEMLTDF